MKKINLVALALTVVASLLYACTKSDDNQQATLQVRLTDNPILGLSEVNVNIQKVRIKFSGDTLDDNGWVDLVTNAGTYNLLALQNGVNVLLATGSFAPNTVQEVRLVLGSNNTVKDTLGMTYPLIVPSDSESGLKLKVGQPLGIGTQTLLIDFDAALSVRVERDGFKLRPVLKIK